MKKGIVIAGVFVGASAIAGGAYYYNNSNQKPFNASQSSDKNPPTAQKSSADNETTALASSDSNSQKEGPSGEKVNLDRVAEDAFMVAVINDPTSPLRQLGLLASNNAINPKIAQILGDDTMKSLERDLGFKVDSIDTYKSLLPSAPYVISLYGDRPQQFTSVFELSYPLPNTAMIGIKKYLAKSNMLPKKEKIGEYLAYFYNEGTIGILVLKDRLIFAHGNNPSDVKYRLEAIGQNSVKPILKSTHADRLQKALSKRFDIMAYVSGENRALKSLVLKDPELKSMDKDFIQAALDFDSATFTMLVSKKEIGFQVETHGHDLNHPKLKPFAQASGRDKFIQQTSLNPLIVYKFAFPFDHMVNLMGVSQRQAYQKELQTIKDEHGFDLEADLINNLGSPISFVVGISDTLQSSPKQRRMAILEMALFSDSAIWVPVKNVAVIESLLEKLIRSNKEPMIDFKKEGSFYRPRILESSTARRLKEANLNLGGFGVYKDHLVIAFTEESLNKIKSNPDAQGALAQRLASDSHFLMGFDVGQFGPFMENSPYFHFLTDEGRQIFDHTKEMTAEIEPFTMDFHFNVANQSARFTSAYRVKTPFRAIFEQKSLPFVSKYFHFPSPHSDSYEKEEPDDNYEEPKPKSFK